MLTLVREREGSFGARCSITTTAPQEFFAKLFTALNRESKACLWGTMPSAECWLGSQPLASPITHTSPCRTAGHPPSGPCWPLLARSTARFTWELAGLLGMTCPGVCAFLGRPCLQSLREGMAAPPFMHTMPSCIVLRALLQRAQKGTKAMKADPGV